METPAALPPCIRFEDDHLLVVNKPAGINTHAPSPYAGEGLHEWLRRREPRWATLAIVHRLDKTTSGLMVFAKSPVANRSLTAQFAERKVSKRYLLLSAQQPSSPETTVRIGLSRAGDRYFARAGGESAETVFRPLGAQEPYYLIEAEPRTGRTHQIRVHAQHQGFPILGDELYGGKAFPRVCLHSAQLLFAHPATGEPLSFRSEPAFLASAPHRLRQELIEPDLTSAFRIEHGETAPGLYLDRWGKFLLAQSAEPLSASGTKLVRQAAADFDCTSIYHKSLLRQPGRAGTDVAPLHLEGPAALESFIVRENGVAYEISFQQGYSVGLFLDQRENRRRLLKNYVAPGFDIFPDPARGEVLNAFAYTCGFSVCAALAGARTTSLDLSRKYLDWGRRNFTRNQINPAGHDFIFGDVFEWAPRLAQKGRRFDLILLDPPTFSHSKSGGPFQAEKHYGRLVQAVLPLLRAGGVLFASSNAQKFAPEAFLSQIMQAVAQARRQVIQQQYVTQPFDFPISQEEPAHLKTSWLRVS